MSDSRTVIKKYLSRISGNITEKYFVIDQLKKRSQMAAFAKNDSCGEQDYVQSGFNFSRQKMQADHSIS